MLNSKRNTYVLTQTDLSYRKLGTMKTLSFINAILFLQEQVNIRLQETRARTGSVNLLQFTDNDFDRQYSVYFAKDRHSFLKENWD